MESNSTKDILRKELDAGPVPAAKVLYARYGGMLFSYVLQFVPDRSEAGDLLAEIFATVASRLHEAFESSLSVYCWLQVESRKIILEHIHHRGNGHPAERTNTFYFSLLEEASPEHQWLFREMFIHGQKKEEVAARSGKDLAHISKILRECLLTIRNKLG